MIQPGAKERLGVLLELDEERKNSTEGFSVWTHCHFTPFRQALS